jgi:hypothetical protein
MLNWTQRPSRPNFGAQRMTCGEWQILQTSWFENIHVDGHSEKQKKKKAENRSFLSEIQHCLKLA